MAPSREADAQRYEALKGEIADLGLIRRGSLVRRFMPCGKPGCRCQAQPPRLHGPYYQWTRKISGKTVTLRLKPHQAQLMEQWIENGRRLNRIIGELERIALRLTKRLLREAKDSGGAGEHHATRRSRAPTRPAAKKGSKNRPK